MPNAKTNYRCRDNDDDNDQRIDVGHDENMKTFALTKGAVGVAVACLFAVQAGAVTMTLGIGLSDTYVLGQAVFNGDNSLVPSGGQETRDLTMVNQLVGIYNGTVTQADPYHLGSPANKFGPPPLPTAVTAGDVVTPAGGIAFNGSNVTITLGTRFTYLIAAYDGPNSGAVVWDISDIPVGTTLEFTGTAQPNGTGDELIPGQYGITTWSLFNPNGGGNVPDGGSTLLLLGAGLSGLGLLRRKLG